jgi:hypothetical protein
MQQARFGLSQNDLAGGGVEVYQFAPYVSYCSAPAPGNVRCAMELVASRTVHKLLFQFCENQLLT